MVVLSVKNFSLDLRTKKGEDIPIVRNVSLEVAPHERVAIVGTSGAGKTILTRALLSLLPENAIVHTKSQVRFQGRDLYKNGVCACTKKMSMAVVLQDPHASLNPAMKVSDQIDEVLPKDWSKEKRQKKIIKLLEDVYLHNPERVSASYPFELSGGMAQRVMIAMMLALNPALLIADEPTSSLDAPVGVGIMKLIVRKIEEQKAALLLISHDINMVRHFCDRIIVMSEGEVVETLAVSELERAQHPRTQQLLKARG